AVHLVHGEGHDVGRTGQVHPPLVEVLHDVEGHQQHRQFGERAHLHLVQREPGGRDDRLLVDADPGLVGDLDAHARSSLCLPFPVERGLRRSSVPFRDGVFPSAASCVACHFSYASTMSPTSLCRTTSLLVSDEKCRSSTPSRISRTMRRPLRCPPGRSTWVMSPVTTTLEPNPSRVRNIFICSGVVFCASSRMTKASLRVRPRM